MDIQNLEKMKLSVAANIGAGLFGLVIPGFLIVFLWDGALFERLDFWKLFVLSVGICLPAFLLPFGFSGLFHRIISHDHPELVSLWGAPVDWYLRHAFNNAINMYTVVFIGWLFDLSVSGLVWVVFFCTIQGALLELFHFWFFKRNPSALFSVWFFLESKQGVQEIDAPTG
ncbi:hypothetical protein [Pseudomonas reidholzensis]|uniref:hypothetical protein n=1 Tax=Pseudomonas reidholzensis TaxID=1785162 RepID=UPI000E5C0A48|nr:hypothetical protein [Pseudomonas reidholzensis]